MILCKWKYEPAIIKKNTVSCYICLGAVSVQSFTHLTENAFALLETYLEMLGV